MGGAEAGKSSIRKVVFEGRNPQNIKTKPTIQFETYLKELGTTRFAIWDTGGQTSYLDEYVEKGSRMFGNVVALIWVVDIAAEDEISRSKFYFDLALENLRQNSPEAKVFCFLHKSDLRETYFDYENLVNFFQNSRFPDIRFHVTSIYEKSVFLALTDVLSNAVITRSTRSLQFLLNDFVDEDIIGVFIFTEEGLPLFEKVEKESLQQMVFVSANLWLGTAERFISELDTADMMDAQLMLSKKHVIVLHHLDGSLLLASIAKRATPIDYIINRTESLAQRFNDAIKNGEELITLSKS